MPSSFVWEADGHVNSIQASELYKYSQNNLPLALPNSPTTNNNSAEIRQYNMGALEKMSQSNSFLDKLIYGTINDAYITLQLFRDKYEKQNLGGGWANPNEAQRAFVNTASYFIPVGGVEASVGEKVLGGGLENIATKTGEDVIEQAAVHGNSLKSLKPTWGYKLYSNDGTLLKNGITSKVIPETRYTKGFMKDKYMEAIPFPNRKAAWNWEFQQNQILRGPLNKNMH